MLKRNKYSYIHCNHLNKRGSIIRVRGCGAGFALIVFLFILFIIVVPLADQAEASVVAIWI
ncbi:YjcZ family sporulation protein [Cytobacillus sp. NCCP-133]|uniref:YjcZ family sporulation protein n=1 Tax=Cytobacillus sp. NCCP-133 TaxID=766848 RepID=UPI003FA4AEF7